MSLTDYVLLYGVTVTVVTIVLDMYNFRGFHRRMARINVLSSVLLLFWPAMDLVNLNYTPPYQLLMSQIATIALSSAMYLKHYFYDELSATYRQRKTMTLGSVIYGGVLATVWYSDFFTIQETRILVHPFLVSLLLLQGGLLTDRVIKHLRNQSRLSSHYGIQSIFNRMNSILFAALLILLFSAAVYLLYANRFSTESTPFVFLVSTGFIFTAILTLVDPLSSLPLSQPVVAIAHVSGDKSFKYVFSSEETGIIKEDTFSIFITQISDLLREMTDSETQLVSFSSRDFLVMFEPTNQGVLLMVLQKRTPLMRFLLRTLARRISKTTLNSDIQFAALVKTTLAFPQTLTSETMFDKVRDYVIVYNVKAAGYKKARKRWSALFERNESIALEDLTVEWLKEKTPRGILILGGDGTVHSVCNLILKNGVDVHLSILPGGGGNDIFNRWMRRDLASYDELGYGSFPVFEVHYPDGEVAYAINSVEWGIGALVATRRENNEGKFLAGMPKYFYLLIKSLFGYRSWSSNLVIDGKMQVKPDLSAVVIGFGSSSMGGGYLMFPDEVGGENESQLFVLIARGFQRFSGLSLILKLARAKQFMDSRVTYEAIKTIELQPTAESVPITIDGELHPAPPVKIVPSEKRVKVLRFE